MRGKIRTFTYTFDKQFHLGTKDQFILEFIQDDKIISTLQKQGKGGSWNALGKNTNYLLNLFVNYNIF